MQLPEPGADAIAASRALQALVKDEILRHDGWISFSRFMELILYAPGLGYYSGGAVKLGKDGDFTTAPEITPLFGQALAHVAADLMAQSSPRLLEFGAGSGRLARDLLTELAGQGVPIEQYAILDLSGQLRARQQEMLRDFSQVVWLDALPPTFSGVVLANEVLDAMPVHLIVWDGQAWQERGVTWEQDRLGYADRPASEDLVQLAPETSALPPGYLTEVHPAAQGFMRTLAALLAGGAGGAALLIDYGFPAAEYYLPQRRQGTVMCHYRHHAHADPFFWPGLQDVTTHLDFSALVRSALEGGADLLGYMDQASFLIGAGIGDLLLRTSPEDALRYLPQANALQRLLSPAEMGELFKVLAIGSKVELAPQLLLRDRSHRL